MEFIKGSIDQLLQWCGLGNASIVVWRQILIVVIIILLAWLSDYICRRLFVPIILKVTSKTGVKWDDIVFNNKVLTAACHIVPALIINALLPIAFYDTPVILEFLSRLSSIYITLATVKFLLVFLSSFKNIEYQNRSSKQQYIVTLCGVLKIIVIFISVIVIAGIIINKSPTRLFAGLGATATILMLVFKDTIVGFASGIRLTSNDMLHKGDWITIPKAGADGVVEDVSLTTVKVRNFDNTIVTIPPQTLVDESFQNWTGMEASEGRRVKRKVFFDFNSIGFASEDLIKKVCDKGWFTPETIRHLSKNGQVVNLTLFRDYIERFISESNDVNSNMLCMVRQLEATQGGLPVEFYFFIKNKAWKPYEHILAIILEQIYALAPEFGLKIYQQFFN